MRASNIKVNNFNYHSLINTSLIYISKLLNKNQYAKCVYVVCVFIDLTEDHWDVIRFLRVHFENAGATLPPAHEFSQTPDERFMDKGGLRYLYELFPDGPLNQGGQIAGITIPADASNVSFGSVQ
jgi:tRNA 2-thiouridine synthesizing protein E